MKRNICRGVQRPRGCVWWILLFRLLVLENVRRDSCVHDESISNNCNNGQAAQPLEQSIFL